MVSTVGEVLNLKRLVDHTRVAMHRKGVSVGENMPFGVMLEVPAAAVCIDDLLDEVDFISIGSNDLIQYLMAAARNNPKVAQLCEPFSPAIFRVLLQVIKACKDHNTPVTLCGEMAGRRTSPSRHVGPQARCPSRDPRRISAHRHQRAGHSHQREVPAPRPPGRQVHIAAIRRHRHCAKLSI